MKKKKKKKKKKSYMIFVFGAKYKKGTYQPNREVWGIMEFMTTRKGKSLIKAQRTFLGS